MSTPKKKPSPFRALLGSRKFVAGLVYSVLALVCAGAAKMGLEWSAEAAAATMTPWVLLGLSNIFGIAYEDGQQKSAGAGTTTVETHKGSTTTIAVVPDADRKP
jgi:hypothetical protein